VSEKPSYRSEVHTLEEVIKLRNPELDDGEITDFLNIIRARIEHVRQVIEEHEGTASTSGPDWEKFKWVYERDRLKELGL